MSEPRAYTGITRLHGRACPSREGGACVCRPRWQGEVYDSRSRRKVRKTFSSLAAAKGWRGDAQGALRRGTMRAPSPVTVRQAAQAWLEGAKAATIRTRSGDRYKPSALRGYEAALNRQVLPELGVRKLADLSRLDIQDFADRLLAAGLDPSSVRNALMPLRAVCRRAVARGELAVNPTAGIELPAVRGRRERFASAEEAAALIQAVPKSDRALWATAFYAGLRRGELQALRWEDVDLACGTLVLRSMRNIRRV
jgi:integrase